VTTIYRILEHKDHPRQQNTLAQSVGGETYLDRYRTRGSQTDIQGISEIYRGESKPIVLKVSPYPKDLNGPNSIHQKGSSLV
jgi:hypothetical protein